jgi:zinc protease
MNDPEGKDGLADVAATLVRRGAGSLDARAYAAAVDALGATLSTGATTENSFVDAEFLARDLEAGLGLCADLLLRPRFDSGEVARAVRQAVAARAQVLDDPARLADDALLMQLFSGHPYGHPAEGRTPTLQTLSHDDIVTFHAHYWTASNTILAIVGDVDPAVAREAVERLLGGWQAGRRSSERPPEPRPLEGRRVVLVPKPGATQSQIRLAQVGIERSDPDYFPVMLVNTVLGGGFTSWLVDEIRVNRGLSYSASSRVYPLGVGGYLRVSTFTKNVTTRETIDVALAQLARLGTDDLDSATLAKAKQYMIGLYPLRLETSDAVARTLAELEFYGQPESWIEEYAQRLESVTLDQARAAARRHFGALGLLLVVVGERDAVESQLGGLGPLSIAEPN